jgi:hypothetical protein
MPIVTGLSEGLQPLDLLGETRSAVAELPAAWSPWFAIVGRVSGLESHGWDEASEEVICRCPVGLIPDAGPDTRGRPPDVPRTGRGPAFTSSASHSLTSFDRIIST